MTNGKMIKILYAEDDAMQAKTCIDYLKRAGYKAVSYTHLDVYKRQDLENDGVDPTFLQLVEFTNKIGFHFVRCHFSVFTLENGLNPCPAKFSLRGLLCR